MTAPLPPCELVAAADRALGIGRGGRLPWRLPREMRFFRRLTCGEIEPGEAPVTGGQAAGAASAGDGRAENAVIMGRRTWESIPEPYRPLAGRQNVVITRRPGYPLPPGVGGADGLEAALRVAGERAPGGRVFVIGGAEVYRQAIVHPACAGIYLTRLDAEYDCDTFFPAIDEAAFELVDILDEVKERGVRYRIERWRRRGGRGAFG